MISFILVGSTYQAGRLGAADPSAPWLIRPWTCGTHSPSLSTDNRRETWDLLMRLVDHTEMSRLYWVKRPAMKAEQLMSSVVTAACYNTQSHSSLTHSPALDTASVTDWCHWDRFIRSHRNIEYPSFWPQRMSRQN